MRTPKPVAPPALSFHTGPAMSRCAHAVSLTNSLRKSAAVIEPPPPGAPRLARSAILELICSQLGLGLGLGLSYPEP